MIVQDKEHYIYEKRDKIRENIIFILLINSIYNLISNYNNLKNTSNPIVFDAIYSAILILLSLHIIKYATDIKRYARRHNINLHKNKYIKSYDKLLLYIFLTISLTRIILFFGKKKKCCSHIDLLRLFFNIFFIFVILYYFKFLF